MSLWLDHPDAVHVARSFIRRGHCRLMFGVVGPYLEGPGDLVRRSITPITRIVTLNISIINLLIKSP